MAGLDTNISPAGVQSGDAEMAALPEPLAVLFDSSRTAMQPTLLKIRKLLKAHSIAVPPAVIPPSRPSRLRFKP
ncbi:hypothetical protein GCM10023100_25800 [Actinocorallia cavernae]|uniref:Uncharacterized protein n=2 Tax=Actinomycetes TaxID=1760 RepID=A0ABP8SLQ2_9ACTN